MTWKRQPELSSLPGAIRVVAPDRGATIAKLFEKLRRAFVDQFGYRPDPARQVELWSRARAEVDSWLPAMSPRFVRLLAAQQRDAQERCIKEGPMQTTEFNTGVVSCETVGYTHEGLSREWLPEQHVPTLAEHTAFFDHDSSTDAKRYGRKLVQGFLERRVVTVHIFRQVSGDYWHALYFTQHDMAGAHSAYGKHAHYLSRSVAQITVDDFRARFEEPRWRQQGTHVPWNDDTLDDPSR